MEEEPKEPEEPRAQVDGGVGRCGTSPEGVQAAS